MPTTLELSAIPDYLEVPDPFIAGSGRFVVNPYLPFLKQSRRGPQDLPYYFLPGYLPVDVKRRPGTIGNLMVTVAHANSY